MFHKAEQMDVTGPSFSLSRNMTSPHMVPVIDLSSESDGRPSGGGGGAWGGVHGRQSAAVMFSMTGARRECVGERVL